MGQTEIEIWFGVIGMLVDPSGCVPYPVSGYGFPMFSPLSKNGKVRFGSGVPACTSTLQQVTN